MSSTRPVIREISDDELKRSAKVIRDSFKTVAIDFGLTRENNPTHPSYTTVRQLRKLRDKGIGLFGLFITKKQIGFVAIEKVESDSYYMEKLAVLPEQRHKGYGKELVKFTLNYMKKKSGKRLSITIINEHTVLKNWYQEQGFKEITRKKFPQLPVTVCFMEMTL